MMFLIAKHGTYLADATEWSQVWLPTEKAAKPFYDRDKARALAETLEATLIPIPCLN